MVRNMFPGFVHTLTTFLTGSHLAILMLAIPIQSTDFSFLFPIEQYDVNSESGVDLFILSAVVIGRLVSGK